MPRILQSKTDPLKFAVELPGGELQEIDQAQADELSKEPGLLRSAVGATKQLAQGLLSIAPGPTQPWLTEGLAQSQQASAARSMQSPLTELAGQAIPAIIGGAAARTVPAIIGTEAAIGASAMPDNPVEGAVIGGTLGSLAGLPQAIRAGRGALQPTRMADRVLGRMSEAAQSTKPADVRGDGGYMKGFATADELKSYNIPTTKGDEAALRSSTQGQFQSAQTTRGREELRRSGILGGSTNDIRNQQQMGLTNYLKDRLQVPVNEGLTPDSLATQFARMGDEFDAHAKNIGSIDINPIKSQLDDISEQATATSKAQVDSIISDINKLAGATGKLSGQDWQQIRTRVSKMINSGQSQGDIGKLSDGHDLMDVLTASMEKGLPTKQAAEILRLRQDYRLAMAMVKPGSLNPAGEVNPVTVLNHYNRYKSKKSKNDDVAKMLSTLKFLQARQTPTSGTAERILNNAPGIILNNLPGGGLLK